MLPLMLLCGKSWRLLRRKMSLLRVLYQTLRVLYQTWHVPQAVMISNQVVVRALVALMFEAVLLLVWRRRAQVLLFLMAHQHLQEKILMAIQTKMLVVRLPKNFINDHLEILEMMEIPEILEIAEVLGIVEIMAER